MAANQVELGSRISAQLKPVFADLGLELSSFVVENLSLPDELQALLDKRIGMNMVGDMSRFTQFEVAQSMPIAAANEGGGAAGVGVGLGAGMAMAQNMMAAMKPAQPGAEAAGAPAAGPASTPSGTPAAGADTKFCLDCGKGIPKRAKFCPECGAQQA
jgi:membrane protease subunit (stomatin/prohibitin family)